MYATAFSGSCEGHLATSPDHPAIYLRALGSNEASRPRLDDLSAERGRNETRSVEAERFHRARTGPATRGLIASIIEISRGCTRKRPDVRSVIVHSTHTRENGSFRTRQIQREVSEKYGSTCILKGRERNSEHRIRTEAKRLLGRRRRGRRERRRAALICVRNTRRRIR